MTTYRGRLVGQPTRHHPVLRALLYAVGTMILLAVILGALIITPGSDSSVHAAKKPTAAAAPPAPSNGPCTRTMAIVRRMLAHLGGDPADWSLAYLTDDYGMEFPTGYYTSRVEISTDTPCWAVPSVVNHEWMHQQQMYWFGRPGMDRRDDIEIMADCGSWLLGSDYTVYLDRARRTGVGCSHIEFAYAEVLIGEADVPLVRHP